MFDCNEDEIWSDRDDSDDGNWLSDGKSLFNPSENERDLFSDAEWMRKDKQISDWVRERGLCKNSFLTMNENEKTEEDYHKIGTALVTEKKLSTAISECVNGLIRFPNSVILMEDLLEYSSKIGDINTSEKYIQMLEGVREKWSGSTYNAVLRYLLLNPQINEQRCRDIIADYSKRYPYDEGHLLVESELEEKLGNYSKSKAILEQATYENDISAKCALKLMRIQMAEGEFDEALKTSDYYGFACCKVQSDESLSTHLYERCLIEDALLHKRYYFKECVSRTDIERIRNMYERIKKIPEIAYKYGAEIQLHIANLDFLKTFDS